MKEKDRIPALICCFILSALNSVFRFMTGGPGAEMNLSGIYYYILCKYDCTCAITMVTACAVMVTACAVKVIGVTLIHEISNYE